MSKILVVIDMQNDFITGSLGSKEATEIVKNVVQKIKSYQAAGDLVFYTRDTHDTNYLETEEGKNLPIEHCIKDTWGWQLEDEIAKTVKEQDHIYNKETFGSLKLGERLQKIAQEDKNLTIELVGLCTDICVISNALLIKAYLPQTPVTVDTTCCAGATKKGHEIAIETMKICHIHIKN